MRRLYLIGLLLSFLPLVQAAWADNVVVFSETFDNTTGTGGNDNNFTGNIALNTIKYDGEAWTGVASYRSVIRHADGQFVLGSVTPSCSAERQYGQLRTRQIDGGGGSGACC